MKVWQLLNQLMDCAKDAEVVLAVNQSSSSLNEVIQLEGFPPKIILSNTEEAAENVGDRES
jgi:fructose-1-phosphate kinase PfkB-like protein